MSAPLEGLRIIDLTQRIAGAYATKLLADAGADVLKVEPPAGDPLRRWSSSGASIPAGEDGALFRFLNASKRSCIADLSQARGRDRILELAGSSDLLIESLEPGEIETLGLGPDALHRQNARLSVVSISCFGRGGPWSGRAATEFTLQALCGSTASRGLPERPPLAAGGRLGEWLGGLYAALAALAAVGRGEHADVSLFEAMSTGLNFYEYLHAALSGDFEAFTAQFGRALEVPSIEQARDGYVGFALFTAQMWRDFLQMVERPDLAEDAELDFMLQRWPRRDEVQAAIRPWLSRHSVDEILEAAAKLRIPAAPIGNARSVLQMDHFAAQGTFVQNPSGGFLQPRVPYRLSGAPTRPFEPAPRLGEHGAETHRAHNSRAALPLTGLRVVDFTQFIAGPLVTHILAGLGADVVKIEGIQRPDGIRFASSRTPDVERWWEYGWVFHGVGGGKRSITLDLLRPEGVDLAKRLIAAADVIVENFAPRVMEGFGLGSEQISEINPEAVYVRMPAFGLRGPWRDRPGLAQTMEQLCGMANITGFRDGPPVIPRGPCDALAGLHACFATLVALAQREGSGEGQHVESIMVEGALCCAAEQLVEYSAYGHLLERDGNRDPVFAPQNLYACRGQEQWLALSIANDAQWAALRSWLGTPAWSADPALEHAPGRRAARDQIDAELGALFAECELDATVDALAAHGIPAAPVLLSPRVTSHPQHRARGFLHTLEHPVVGRQEYPGLPWRWSDGRAGLTRRPPPLLGEHNAEVLGGELGLDAAELEHLRHEEIIGEQPKGF